MINRSRVCFLCVGIFILIFSQSYAGIMEGSASTNSSITPTLVRSLALTNSISANQKDPRVSSTGIVWRNAADNGIYYYDFATGVTARMAIGDALSTSAVNDSNLIIFDHANG